MRATGRASAAGSVGEPRLLIVPAWAYYLVFFMVPVGFMVAYAFAINDPDRFFVVQHGFHLDQFRRLWDPLFLRIYRDTFVLAALGTLGCLLIGYPFAYWIAGRSGRRKTLALLLVVVPFWTSLLIRTYAWVILLSENGPISSVLQDVHLLSSPLNILYTPRAVFIGMVYDYLPLMVFPLYVAIERMDRGLVEASRDLGASRWRTFRQVTLPLTMPGIMTGCLLTFIPMLGEYVVPQILGGAKSFLIGSLVANQVVTAVDWPFGAALSVVLVVVLLAVIFVYLRVLGRRAEESLGATF
ncbi:MAG TPA: ABC transporter permease [Actinomycetota bacterium]|nr:ABC transporter permease [Actinomycetota bacterium]